LCLLMFFYRRKQRKQRNFVGFLFFCSKIMFQTSPCTPWTPAKRVVFKFCIRSRTALLRLSSTQNPLSAPFLTRAYCSPGRETVSSEMRPGEGPAATGCEWIQGCS
jgi:hypothetical protein